MLRRLGEELLAEANVAIKDATLPLFPSELEYNAPMHGTWNIVHIGMQIPEAHQIYVCSDNCMRGVVMTAAEMNCLDRFHQVVLEEHDLYTGNLEDITIEGVTDILQRLDSKPPMVLVFTVCLHHFLGSNYRYIEETLNARFPETDVVIAYMDPIMQKVGPTPEMKLRDNMFHPLQALPVEKDLIVILGGDVPLGEDSDLLEVLKAQGYRVRQLSDLADYQSFLALGHAAAFICHYPTGKMGIERLAKRLERPCVYVPVTYNDEEQAAYYQRLNLSVPDHQEELAAAIAHAKALIQDTPIAIDYTATPRPLSLARFLLDQGFHVTSVYLDALSDEEHEDFTYLKNHYPELQLKATIHIYQRLAHLIRQEEVLAIGQKAAFFNQTGHFVNMIEGGGLEGQRGRIKLMSLLEEAYLHTLDTRDIVPRKGLGCESCI